MDNPLRIAEIEISQATTDERIVGLFRYDSELGARKGPALFLIADISSTLYAYEQLLDTLNNAAEQTRALLSATGIDSMARFEKLIERLNQAVAEFVEHEPHELNWNRISLYVLEVFEGRVCIAGLGQLSNIFLQKQSDGSYRAFDLLGSLDIPSEINPRKPFASILCGDIKNGDLLFVGTNNFERLRSELGITSKLKTLPPVTAALEIKQELERRAIPDDFVGVVIAQVEMASRAIETPVIEEQKTKTSFEKLQSAEKKTEEILAPSISPPKPAMTLVGLWARAKDFTQKIGSSPKPSALKKHPTSVTSMRGMSAGHGRAFTPDHKRTLLISVAILLILGGSGAWFYSKQKFKAEQELWNTVFDQATDRKTRAESDLVYGNEDRTRSLITEAKTLLDGLDEQTSDRAAAKAGLQKELDTLSLKLKREQQVTPIELTSASLGAAEGSFVSPTFKNGKTYVMDRFSESLVEVTPATKEVKRYRLPDGSGSVQSIVSGSSGLYLMTENRTMLSFDLASGGFSNVSWSTKASSTQALALYGKRFYVLDPQGNMVWRYAPSGGGISQETAYLKQNSMSLAQAVGIAVDSNVYVLLSDGSIRRYLAGTEEGWKPAIIDPPLTSGSSIWTATDIDRIVVADTVGKRVVVFRKDGKLVTQLVSNSWNGPSAVFGDEVGKKIYVVDNNKLWQVDLP